MKIKFRGKGINDNKWHFGFFAEDYTGVGNIIFWESKLIEPETNHWEPVFKNIECMLQSCTQFTGFIDNKKQEIYVGDILNRGDSGELKYQVIFEDGAFWAKNIIYPHICSRLTQEFISLGFCVVGNMLDNLIAIE